MLRRGNPWVSLDSYGAWAQLLCQSLPRYPNRNVFKQQSERVVDWLVTHVFIFQSLWTLAQSPLSSEDLNHSQSPYHTQSHTSLGRHSAGQLQIGSDSFTTLADTWPQVSCLLLFTHPPNGARKKTKSQSLIHRTLWRNLAVNECIPGEPVIREQGSWGTALARVTSHTFSTSSPCDFFRFSNKCKKKNVSLDVCAKFNSYKILWLTTEPKRNVLWAHRRREPFPSHEQVMRSWAEEMTSMPSGVNICKFYRIKFPNRKLASVMSFGNCPWFNCLQILVWNCDVIQSSTGMCVSQLVTWWEKSHCSSEFVAAHWDFYSSHEEHHVALIALKCFL